MADKQPPTVVEGATTGDVEDELPSAAKSAEDRKAASALASLDAASSSANDDGSSAKNVDHDAVSKAIKSLGGGAGAGALKKPSAASSSAAGGAPPRQGRQGRRRRRRPHRRPARAVQAQGHRAAQGPRGGRRQGHGCVCRVVKRAARRLRRARRDGGAHEMRADAPAEHRLNGPDVSVVGSLRRCLLPGGGAPSLGVRHTRIIIWIMNTFGPIPSGRGNKGQR